jgi:hypothetical protein
MCDSCVAPDSSSQHGRKYSSSQQRQSVYQLRSDTRTETQSAIIHTHTAIPLPAAGVEGYEARITLDTHAAQVGCQALVADELQVLLVVVACITPRVLGWERLAPLLWAQAHVEAQGQDVVPVRGHTAAQRAAVAEMQQHASGAQQSLQGPWNEEILAGLGAATASGIA